MSNSIDTITVDLFIMTLSMEPITSVSVVSKLSTVSPVSTVSPLSPVSVYNVYSLRRPCLCKKKRSLPGFWILGQKRQSKFSGLTKQHAQKMSDVLLESELCNGVLLYVLVSLAL